jgi:hypothetical protein
VKSIIMGGKVAVTSCGHDWKRRKRGHGEDFFAIQKQYLTIHDRRIDGFIDLFNFCSCIIGYDDKQLSYDTALLLSAAPSTISA